MRKWLVPETVQTSAMDRGPAALKSLLEGFGIHAAYGRLREACQTDVDGTSIDTLEETAVALGLEAVQVVAPADHLLLKEARNLPALAVVKLPTGDTHFTVVWSIAGLVQMMDPATGRRWQTPEALLSDLFIHTQAVPAEAWREWAVTPSFTDPLRRRMKNAGVRDLALLDATVQEAAPEGDGWRKLAALDAAVRMTASLIQHGAVSRGGAAGRMVRRLAAEPRLIPERYWSAIPAADGQVRIRGAVFVTVSGRRREPVDLETLSPELAAALREKPESALWELWRTVRSEGLLAPAATIPALGVASACVVVQAFLFRGLIDLGGELALRGQRMGAAALILCFLAAVLLMELPLAAAIFRLGRKLECRLRLRFLNKIPLLSDRYFQSRLVSDMAQRSHSVQALRQAPELASRFLRAVFEMGLTVVGIAWLFPASAPLAVLAAVLAIGIALFSQPVLAERDLRLRNQLGAISRFYMGAMQGLTAIRAHGAERPLRGEQGRILEGWARAGMDLQRAAVAAQGLQLVCGFGLAAALVLLRLPHMDLAGGREAGGVLLLVYWALNLPALGEQISETVWQYPGIRNALLRFVEPLGAPEEHPPKAAAQGVRTGGVRIGMEDVRVVAGGHVILDGVSVEIEPGAHVAVVGSSGAGKSTLAGLLLGWHRPAEGRVLIDGEPLDTACLRRETAWVDPQTQLWNRAFLDNIRYGAGAGGPVEEVLDKARLRGVIEKLPEGMQTPLGEGGALVSGGEGQRVRFGRALMKSGVRLAILDEPARGLDRDTRRDLIEAARRHWQGVTLLCITHDVIDTSIFDRVLVVEGGRIIEGGSPDELSQCEGGRYRALLAAEQQVRHNLWSSARWRKFTMESGVLSADPAGTAR